MNWKAKTISILSIFLLAGGSCAIDGDFCAAYTPVPPISEKVATELVSADRASAVAIAANETFYQRQCQ